MEEIHKRRFTGIWISKSIWINKNLSIQEKTMFAEIDSLDNDQGCFASNGYFAEFFGLTKVRISNIINALVQKGYIESVIDKHAGNKRILHSLLKETLIPSQTIVYDPIKENFNHIDKAYSKIEKEEAAPREKLVANGFIFSEEDDVDSIEHRTRKDSPRAREAQPKFSDDVDNIYQFWVQTFARHASAKLTPKRKTKISARLKESYTVENIRNAILGCSITKWNCGGNPDNRFWQDIELICRDGGQVERFQTIWLSRIQAPKMSDEQVKMREALRKSEEVGRATPRPTTVKRGI